MFGSVGPTEIIVVAVVVVLLFGVGKISGLGKELGSSIKEFRKAVKDEDAEEGAEQPQMTAQAAPPPAPVQQAPVQQTQVAPPPAAPAAQQQAPAPPPAPAQNESQTQKNIF